MSTTAGVEAGVLLDRPVGAGSLAEALQPAPRQAGGRKHLPLGREVRGLPLRSPGYWPRGTPWPPPLAKAKADLVGRRNAMRSCFSLFSYAGALAKTGIEDGDVPALVEAYSVFSEIASSENDHHFARHRALALYNATACMNALPLRAARSVAGDLLVRAVQAIGDSYLQAVTKTLTVAAEDVEENRSTVSALQWKGDRTLVPVTSEGCRRIRTLRPVEGTWAGLRGNLLSRGLYSPIECRMNAPLFSAVPTSRTVQIRALS